MSAKCQRNLVLQNSKRRRPFAQVVSGLRETLQQFVYSRGAGRVPVGREPWAIALRSMLPQSPPSSIRIGLPLRREGSAASHPGSDVAFISTACRKPSKCGTPLHGKHSTWSSNKMKKNVVMKLEDAMGSVGAVTRRDGTPDHEASRPIHRGNIDRRSEQGTQITIRVPKGDAS